MITKLPLKRRGERGFSLMELMIALVIIIILVAVVILVVRGFYGGARESAMESDLHTVKNAVDDFLLRANPKWPTESGTKPAEGEYALIDFDASFNDGGKTMTLYPHFLSKLPRHADEGVWRINSVAQVSLDLAEEEY